MIVLPHKDCLKCESYFNRVIELKKNSVAKGLDNAFKYLNFIITGWFVGFFGIFSFIQTGLTSEAKTMSTGFIILSIICFLIYQSCSFLYIYIVELKFNECNQKHFPDILTFGEKLEEALKSFSIIFPILLFILFSIAGVFSIIAAYFLLSPFLFKFLNLIAF